MIVARSIQHGQYGTFATAVVNLCLTLLHGCYTLVCVSGRGAPVVRKETVMDINCPKCGEPWELETFHDVADDKDITFGEAMNDFRAGGCSSTGWTKCSPRVEGRARAMAGASAVLFELLGDDIDGVAAMLEDFEGSF